MCLNTKDFSDQIFKSFHQGKIKSKFQAPKNTSAASDWCVKMLLERQYDQTVTNTRENFRKTLAETQIWYIFHYLHRKLADPQLRIPRGKASHLLIWHSSEGWSSNKRRVCCEARWRGCRCLSALLWLWAAPEGGTPESTVDCSRSSSPPPLGWYAFSERTASHAPSTLPCSSNLICPPRSSGGGVSRIRSIAPRFSLCLCLYKARGWLRCVFSVCACVPGSVFVLLMFSPK